MLFRSYVLLDPGSTHSFVSIAFSEHLHKPHTCMAQPLLVSTPMGDVVLVDMIYKDSELKIEKKELNVDLIPMTIYDFDMILGMD